MRSLIEPDVCAEKSGERGSIITQARNILCRVSLIPMGN